MSRALALLVAVTYACFSPAFLAGAEATTLYAGVSHTDAMSHVDEVRTRVKDPTRINATPSPRVTEIAKPDQEHALSANVTTTAPAISSEITKAGQNVMPPQGYLPAFGVAHAATPKEVIINGRRRLIQWFKIPPFMAGTWSKDGDLTVEVTNLATGTKSYPNVWVDNKLNATWGHQVDGIGNIWHVNLLPAERDGFSDGKMVRFMTVAQQCEHTSPAQLVTRTHYLVSESDAMNGAPEGTFQQESINDYILDPQTQGLTNTSSNRVFSYHGAPVRDGQLLSKFRKVSNFSPVPTMMGLDLRQSLKDFLNTQGQSY